MSHYSSAVLVRRSTDGSSMNDASNGVGAFDEEAMAKKSERDRLRRAANRAAGPQGWLQRFIDSDDGAKIAVRIGGVPDAPVTVILCHGYMAEGSRWGQYAENLAKKARVVVWDQRGHGWSDTGAHDRLTMEQLGRDLHAVIEATTPSGPIMLVGHSMGGMTILALAEYERQLQAGGEGERLFGGRVQSVALLTTSAKMSPPNLGGPRWRDSGLTWFAGKVLAVSARAGISASAIRTFARWTMIPRLSPAIGPMIDKFVERAGSTSFDALARLLPAMVRFDKEASVAELAGADVLVMTTGNDVITPPSHGEAILGHLPRARHQPVADAGHFVTDTHPEAVNKVLMSMLEGVMGQRSAGECWPERLGMHVGLPLEDQLDRLFDAAAMDRPAPSGLGHDEAPCDPQAQEAVSLALEAGQSPPLISVTDLAIPFGPDGTRGAVITDGRPCAARPRHSER